MISCKCKAQFSFKFVAKTNLFDKGFCDFSWLSLTVSWFCWLIFVFQWYKNLRFDVLLYFSRRNLRRFMFSYHQKCPCQNQWKSFTSFLAYHFPRATHLPGFKIMPRFVEVLCFSSLCVKIQPTECNISINFDHFSSSFNHVRGVTNQIHPRAIILKNSP